MRDMSSCWASPHFQRVSPILPRRWRVRLDHPTGSLTSRRCGDCLGAMLPITTCLLWLPYFKDCTIRIQEKYKLPARTGPRKAESELPPNYFSCYLGPRNWFGGGNLAIWVGGQSKESHQEPGLLWSSAPIPTLSSPGDNGLIVGLGDSWFKNFSYTQSQGILEQSQVRCVDMLPTMKAWDTFVLQRYKSLRRDNSSQEFLNMTCTPARALTCL